MMYIDPAKIYKTEFFSDRLPDLVCYVYSLTVGGFTLSGMCALHT